MEETVPAKIIYCYCYNYCHSMTGSIKHEMINKSLLSNKVCSKVIKKLNAEMQIFNECFFPPLFLIDLSFTDQIKR